MRGPHGDRAEGRDRGHCHDVLAWKQWFVATSSVDETTALFAFTIRSGSPLPNESVKVGAREGRVRLKAAGKDEVRVIWNRSPRARDVVGAGRHEGDVELELLSEVGHDDGRVRQAVLGGQRVQAD